MMFGTNHITQSINQIIDGDTEGVNSGIDHPYVGTRGHALHVAYRGVAV